MTIDISKIGLNPTLEDYKGRLIELTDSGIFNVNHKPRANTLIPKMNTKISMSTPQMWENKQRDQTEPVPKLGNLVLVMNHQEAKRLRNTPKALGNKKEK